MDNEERTCADITELKNENSCIFDGAQRYKDFDFDEKSDSEDSLVTRFRLNEGR